MKVLNWTLAILVSFPLGAGQLLSAEPEASGTMMVVKGTIKVTSQKTQKTENAKVGYKVFAGDIIESGPDSRAKIIMSDKNVLNISPDSKVTIARYENNPAKNSRNVDLKVDYGKVRASVSESYDGEKNKFNIRTPTAVAGVRGTDFITGFDVQTKTTQVITFSGVVAVGKVDPRGSIVNPVFVRPGQSTTVGDLSPASAPVSVPREQIQSMEKDSDAGSVPQNREPNAAPAAAAPSMVNAKDLDTSISKEIKAAPELMKAPAAYMPAVQPALPPTQNQFIDNAIRNTPSKVKIEICRPGASC